MCVDNIDVVEGNKQGSASPAHCAVSEVCAYDDDDAADTASHQTCPSSAHHSCNYYFYWQITYKDIIDWIVTILNFFLNWTVFYCKILVF